MTSRIDVIGQNGGTGEHYVLADLLQLNKLVIKYDEVIWAALDEYVSNTWDGQLSEWEWGEGGFIVGYSRDSACCCCSYDYSSGFVSIKEVVGKIEDAITNS